MWYSYLEEYSSVRSLDIAFYTGIASLAGGFVERARARIPRIPRGEWVRARGRRHGFSRCLVARSSWFRRLLARALPNKTASFAG